MATDVSIYSEAFHKLREDFDKMMISTITNMRQKGSSDASLTVKIDIELEKTFEPIELKNGERSMRDVYIPHFSHKVSSAMAIKEEVKGKYDEECELIWNPASQTYLLVPIGQMSLEEEYNRTEANDE